jgi:hypothetical protein
MNIAQPGGRPVVDRAGRIDDVHADGFMSANSSSTMPSVAMPSMRAGLSMPATISFEPLKNVRLLAFTNLPDRQLRDLGLEALPRDALGCWFVGAQ